MATFFVLLWYPERVIRSAWIGTVAGLLTTSSFLPQVWQSFRSRSCRDLSFAMLIVMFSGTTLWTLYGILLHRWPIIVPNAITACLLAGLIGMKASYHPKDRS